MRHGEFCNFASIMLIVAVLSTLGITCGHYVPTRNNDINYELCTSQICEEAGKEMIENLDQSVAPCDNFYGHACGGWMKNHPVGEKHVVVSQFEVIEMKLQEQLREILQKNETSDTETLRKVRDYYRSCLDLAAIDSRGLSPLESIVLANGGWPLTLPANIWRLENTNLTLQKIHENYAKVVGSSALFVIAVAPQKSIYGINLLKLTAPIVPSNRSRWFTPRRKKRYSHIFAYDNFALAVAEEFAKLREFNVSADNINEDLKHMYEFEFSLNQIYSSVATDAYDDEPIDRITTIAEVQNRWDKAVSEHPEYEIDWLETIRSAFDGTGIVINATQKISIPRDDIIAHLADLLKTYPLRTVVNYVHWHAVDRLVLYTNKKMREISNVMFKTRYGYVNNDDERSIFCIDNHIMPEGLSYAWVQEYFTKNISLNVMAMVSEIQEEMKRQIDQSTWMDDEAKFRSKKKINDMVKYIGYPSWYDDYRKIDQYYDKLAVGPDFFENVVNYNKFKTITSLKKLWTLNDKHRDFETLLSGNINMHYALDLNSLFYPAAMTQMPFFHAERPLVLNYGHVGTMIGHEIAHAFGIEGIQYDEVGNKKKWWSESTIAGYTERAQCFIDQYSNYTLHENDIYGRIKINGMRTAGENIADNVGFAIALKAYLSYKKQHKLEDIRIPALQDYTDEMLFFYSFSNTYCSSQKPEAAVIEWYDSDYSPYANRINGVVSNMPEFSKAFNCPRGSPMNPVKKCAIWDDKLCETQICKEAGNEIVKSIDQSIDPCNNFYEHACGGWIANHPVPKGQLAISQFQVLEIKLQQQLRGILQKNETSNSETLRKVRDYYRSCLDLAAIDARGLSPLESIVLANGGWPLTLPSNFWRLENTNLTLQKIHENYAKVVGSSALFGIAVAPHKSIYAINLLKLTAPISPSNRSRWFTPRRKKRYSHIFAYDNFALAVAEEFAKLRGFNVSADNINEDLKHVYEFEFSLNQIYSSVATDAYDDEPIDRITTIAEVQNTWDKAVSEHPEYEIDWLETIRSAFDGTGIVINATQKISIPRDDIIAHLADLLKTYPLRTVVNYVHWHAVDRLVLYTNKKMREISNVMFKTRYGYVNNDDERSIFCIDNHIMSEGLSYAWVQEYFTKNISLNVMAMVSEIQEEMKRRIDQSTWMDDEAKFRSKKKINNMVKYIGYPSWYDDYRKIDQYYDKLAVGPDFFENVVNYNKFKTITSLRKFWTLNDKHRDLETLLSGNINLHYGLDLNSLFYLAEMTQMPFFHAERPLVLNYGHVGTMIGHEIAHAFGIEGIQYDEVGNEKKWWSESTIAGYTERAQCFIDQYSNYTLHENDIYGRIKINGMRTAEENIADNVGFAIALKAYLSYKKQHKLEDIRIPALQDYTDEMLFFYSFSNTYCSSEKPEAAVIERYNSLYSRYANRINGVVSNMPEFSKAFNCPRGSPMNPVKKCAIWDDKLCETQICKEAGNEIVKSIDQSIDPCNNFYEHACGGWIANHPVPKGQLATSQFQVLAIKLQQQLRGILQKNETSNSETLRKVRDYYRSCYDLAAIDARGLSPLESIVLANGGWPLTVPLSNWSLADQNLTLQKIHENYGKVSGSSALFDFKVVPSTLKTGTNLLKLKPPVTPANRQGSSIPQRKKRYSRTNYYDDYALTVAKDFAELRGFNVSSDNIFNDVLRIFQIEFSLINLDYGTQYRVTTIAEVQNTWNTVISGRPEYAIDWLETIRSAFDGTGIVINATEQIQVPGENFPKKLGVLLKAYPLRSVVNYVHWHAIDSLVSYTNKKMRDLSNILSASRNEYVYNDDQRSTFCIDQHTMRLGLSYAYVREYFGKNSSQTIINMVYQIQEEMSHQFNKSGWIDVETKFRLEKRLRNMTMLVGYPNYYDEPGKIDEFYNKLVVGPDYFENIVNYNKFSTITLLKELREPYDEYNIGLDFFPTQLNILSDLDLNIIRFPAAILQMPNFHAERPMVLNYGSIGAAIGYEISNALVIQDRINTNVYRNNKWWINPLIIKYHERAMCFIDQYSNYTHINEQISLKQNIAENTGFAIALKAYLSYKKKYNFENIKIPGLQSYTDDKLFFYSLSNYYCASEAHEFADYLLFNKKQYPAAVRVNGVLSNMPEFSETFNCPIGSPMNPVKKCVFWD